MRLRDLPLRLRALITPRRVERDLHDELSFHIERETRKLILAQTTRPVAYGLLAGVGLAAALATILIATPGAATIAQIVHVTDPIAYAASLSAIVAACLLAAWIPARRAARLDPMRTLRQE